MVYFITLVFIIIIAIQVPAMIKQKAFKELAVYSVLMLTALVYGYSEVLDWNLPVPDRLIILIFESLSKLVYENQPTH